MEELARESIRSISLLYKPARGSEAPRLGSFGAVFIMLKSALGAGLLNFPWAFGKAGGVNRAISVELVSLIFLVSGLVILGYASSISRQNSYHEVVRGVCGRRVGHLCQICFVFNLFMISVAFLVVVQDQLDKLCLSLYETVTGRREMPYHWYTDQSFVLFLMCLIIILPLSVPKEIGIQKYTSVLGTLAASFLCVAITVKYYMKEEHAVSLRPEHTDGLHSWVSVFSVVPTICFGFQCHEACIAIYSSMENKSILHWTFISGVSMIFCLVIYTLTGVFGFLTFGREVASDILMSYPGNDVVMIIARLLFGISIITIYPIILLLGRSVIMTLMLGYREKRAMITEMFESRCRWFLTTLWITVTLVVAIYVPDMSDVISVIGGVSAFFIFIFPGLCLIFAMQTEPVDHKKKLLLIGWGVVTVVVGVFIFGQSTTIAVMELTHKS
ncbi:putative sodium-coupled neutral amino acid transporter 8 [Brachyhypopomus gauderio]|uniref:putative sodium-coupled neutral amino acid transporter 8 n=1 Tax=Brachyhypopomus gauderio TaxID=698409 RepID=UPI0040416C4E